MSWKIRIIDEAQKDYTINMERTFLKIYLIIYRELAPESQFIKSLLVAQRLLGYNYFVRNQKGE